jgi:peptide/nickel transport system ATP-binding protein
MSKPLFELSHLSVAFSGRTVVHDVSLVVNSGEALGVVGESGCGKSVTFLASLGLLPAKARAAGFARLDGDDILNVSAAKLESIRGRRVAMIFQDPSSSMNPVLRVGHQIGEALALHRGLTGAAARVEARRLLDDVGIPDAANRLNAYPHELSGGQNQRIMIAMALAGEPDMLIADEPTTALDATVQAQILGLIDTIRRDRGMALVLISHDLGAIASVCERVAVMYAGVIVEASGVDAIFDRPQHPYTRGLLAALPELEGPRRRLTPISGTVPEPWNLPEGCAFAPRCNAVSAVCRQLKPELFMSGSAAGLVACHHPSDEMESVERIVA